MMRMFLFFTNSFLSSVILQLDMFCLPIIQGSILPLSFLDKCLVKTNVICRTDSFIILQFSQRSIDLSIVHCFP